MTNTWFTHFYRFRLTKNTRREKYQEKYGYGDISHNYQTIMEVVKVKIMKKILLTVLVGYSVIGYTQTGNMNSSPYNMENSIYNMENSPYNMRNSPYNMDNSQYNMNSKNGVYDNQGNRTGYQVKEPSGVTNYYYNKGNRTGYTPSQR